MLYQERDRAESFGAAAADYDRYRPSYPDALVDDLLALAPGNVLDIGCGTGKFARQLAERGVDVLGIEPDPRMAEVARGHGLPVEVASFETWQDSGRRFDLITAAQAWHWVEPRAGAAKVTTLLRPGGWLAVFWNDDNAGADFEDVYRVHAPELMPLKGAARPQYRRRLAETGHFAHLEARRYNWQRTYSADDWIGYLRTHSNHLTFPADRLETLCAALREQIDARGGLVHVQGHTYALLARPDTG
jgi:SAM-dependent methyltransferase